MKLTDVEMRLCQISRQKAIYLKEISNVVLSGNLDFENLNQTSESKVREILTSIKASAIASS